MVRARLQQASDFFFPFSKLEHDKAMLPKLFTLFDKQGEEILEHEALQKYLKMSPTFHDRMPF
jgi:hypothetical protein